MEFKDALFDGSDPFYTPCSSWTRDRQYWKAPKKYRDLGYAFKMIRLPGQRGDGCELDRAIRAKELTREMLKWFEADEPKMAVGTIKWLLARYHNDMFSPFQNIKANSKIGYRKHSNYWEQHFGRVVLGSIKYEHIMTWQRKMKENGKSVSFISKVFNHLRTVIKYGVKIENTECLRLSIILAETTFKQPKPKSIAPTPAQVHSVISAAEEAGAAAFALGIQFQWWYHLRCVDVRGQYLDLAKGDERSGIIKGNRRWCDGLEWSMFDKDLAFFEKTQSKTERHGVDSLRCDLTIVPEIRDKLMAVPKDERVGPLTIKPSTGLPYSPDEWSRLWRTYADIAGLSKEIKVMDVRAGALSDGQRHGATRTQLKNAAGHTNEDTTERYMRGGAEDMNKVVKLRREQ